MKLEPREIATPLWGKLVAHYEAILTELRERNDRDRSEAETIKLRAKIRTIKEFLALGIPDAETEAAADE